MFCYDENVPGVHKRYLRAQFHHYAKLNNVTDELFPHGHCHGYALTHSVMAATGALPRWQATLIAIASWDRERASLARIVHINDEPYVLQQLFEESIALLRFHQTPKLAFTGSSQLDFITQPELLQVYDPSERRTLTIARKEQYAIASGHFHADHLVELLTAGYLANSLIIIAGYHIHEDKKTGKSSAIPHACTARVNQAGDYYFYCANENDGEQHCGKRVENLVAAVTERLTCNLSIRLVDLSGKHPEKIATFERHYQRICQTAGPALLNDLGAVTLLRAKQYRTYGELAKKIDDKKSSQALLVPRLGLPAPVKLAFTSATAALATCQTLSSQDRTFNINAPIYQHLTPLALAAMRGNNILVKKLLRHPKLNMQYVCNQKALSIAIEQKHDDIVVTLSKDGRIPGRKQAKTKASQPLAATPSWPSKMRLLSTDECKLARATPDPAHASLKPYDSPTG
jgi:hypothetical protein